MAIDLDIISPTKPHIASLELNGRALTISNPFGVIQEIKEYRELGEMTFRFGNGIAYLHAEEKVRLPNANSFLSLETINLNSEEKYNQNDLFWDIPEFDENSTYVERVRYYQIDPEIIKNHFEQWNDYRSKHRGYAG